MATFRWIHDNQTPNQGFSNEEIQRLESILNVPFPNDFIEFLKKAGVFPNILGNSPTSVELMQSWNQTLIESLKNNDLGIQKPVCFLKKITVESLETYYFPKEEPKEMVYYYFIDCAQSNLPVYTFSDGMIYYEPQPGYVTTKSIGIQKIATSLREFVQTKTNEKYGKSLAQKVKDAIFNLLLLPFTLPVVLFLFLHASVSKIEWSSIMFFWRKK
ncbi:MAG: hypothetical protein RL607_2299 [Bacteroidota bacterium]|jgi:hypothetical protein